LADTRSCRPPRRFTIDGLSSHARLALLVLRRNEMPVGDQVADPENRHVQRLRRIDLTHPVGTLDLNDGSRTAHDAGVALRRTPLRLRPLSSGQSHGPTVGVIWSRADCRVSSGSVARDQKTASTRLTLELTPQRPRYRHSGRLRVGPELPRHRVLAIAHGPVEVPDWRPESDRPTLLPEEPVEMHLYLPNKVPSR
jgi:hypothetical protein